MGHISFWSKLMMIIYLTKTETLQRKKNTEALLSVVRKEVFIDLMPIKLSIYSCIVNTIHNKILTWQSPNTWERH
jgi:hypothetical protein